MDNEWFISSEDKAKYMAEFVPYLPVLRVKAGISQEELSNLIGVSRQTYGSFERNVRNLTWNTFLSLLLFFDYNQSTHKLLHSSCSFLDELIKKLNRGQAIDNSLNRLFTEEQMEILSKLDVQALNSVRTMLMVEYARCADIPGEMVVRAFDGVNFNFDNTEKAAKAEKAEIALKMINKRKKEQGDE